MFPYCASILLYATSFFPYVFISLNQFNGNGENADKMFTLYLNNSILCPF